MVTWIVRRAGHPRWLYRGGAGDPWAHVEGGTELRLRWTFRDRASHALNRAIFYLRLVGTFCAALVPVSDVRTLPTLSIRAGVNLETEATSRTTFWAHQRFVPAEHEGLRIIRRWLQDELRDGTTITIALTLNTGGRRIRSCCLRRLQARTAGLRPLRSRAREGVWAL